MSRIFARQLSLALVFLFLVTSSWAQTNNLAPGAPGGEAQWPSAGKSGVGTSNTLESKVWFTLREGVLTDVYYPTVDVANTRVLQLVIVSADGKRVETEMEDTAHRVEVLDPQALTFRQINTAKSGDYTITKTYVTDPTRSTLLIDVTFKGRGGERLHVYYDPSLNNSGMHDSAWSQGHAGGLAGKLVHGEQALLSSDADKASALVYSPRPKELGFFGRVTTGYFETSDGLGELKRKGQLGDTYLRAADGNVVQVAEISAELSGVMGGPLSGTDTSDTSFTLALGFGSEPEEALKNARQSLFKGFAAARAEYEQGWHEYLSSLRRVAAKYQTQFDMAAMILRAHEDKTYRGANIASLSVPWGGGANANEPNVGGYHLVWSRDLYQVATALYAMGDKAGADRALNYLFKVQQKTDGSFPQNSWLDGRPFWGSLQMDEVAYPLVLAYTLGRTDNETWTKHVKPAADFLIKHGPRTPQERWEEKPGFSPSTIAAEIAGLVCAAEIARRNDDQASAGLYLAAADEWARGVERFTVTSTGQHGDGTYYLRITENDDPNDRQIMNAGNGGGDHDEREYVDAGFLELVRLGIKRPDDPLIERSLAVVDKVIKVETPNGPAWYRYNYDGYGEMDDGRRWNFDGKYTGKGRLWALLSGERGQYELARGDREAARKRLDHLLGFANEGLMIPEQVWDQPQSPRPAFKFGEGTGSATPLAWSMAQFIRLAANIEEGRNLETPDIVAARYVKQPIPAKAMLLGDDRLGEEMFATRAAGEVTPFDVRFAPGTRVFVGVGDQRREVEVKPDGAARTEIVIPQGESWLFLAVHAPSGATAFSRVRLPGHTSAELQREATRNLTPEFVERLKSAKESPLIDSERVTFFYRGPAQQVELTGDFTGWNTRGFALQNLPGTDVKFHTRRFASSARAEYQFIADGKWMTDPLNPRKNDNGVGGTNSFFTMPGYSANSATLKETSLPLETFELPSRVLGVKRRIQVYLPPGYRDGNERYPVLYLQDGSEYATRSQAAVIAEDLIKAGRVEPFVIVFVNPVERMKEYWASDKFAEFMATELVPYVDGRYRTRPAREARALLGASLGSVISYWTALKYPEMFARVGGQSSAFQIEEERVLKAMGGMVRAGESRRPFRFYLDVGTMEPLWEVNRRARLLLAAKGYPVVYREFEAGHNWTAWRDQLAEAYLALWKN
ncbi:MAG: glycoside hydrolase family 15 protein [Pyrinomonadaceae bacterium]